jgi:hypothetical protein
MLGAGREEVDTPKVRLSIVKGINRMIVVSLEKIFSEP